MKIKKKIIDDKVKQLHVKEMFYKAVKKYEAIYGSFQENVILYGEEYAKTQLEKVFESAILEAVGIKVNGNEGKGTYGAHR